MSNLKICEQIYDKDNSLEYYRDLQQHIEYVLITHDLFTQQLKSFISQLSADTILDLIKEIHEFKTEIDAIEKATYQLQQRLQEEINEDKNSLKNDIEQLRKYTNQLKLKLEEFTSCNKKRLLEEQQVHLNDQLNDRPETIQSSLVSRVSKKKTNQLRSDDDNTTRTSMTQPADETSVVSNVLLNLISPSILDPDENETNQEEEEEVETIVTIDSKTTPNISRKIHLSNSIVDWLQGPLKIMISGSLHMVEMFALKTYINDAIRRAAKETSDREKEMAMNGQTMNNSLKPAFTEITSDWTLEGENSDKGFSSASIWMRDPQGRRILVKIQDHPLAAANEWLGYILGRILGLPTNEVQIAIYENKLATLHTDATHEDEKTITLTDLPKTVREKLMIHPIMARMDLFDHIIQNVDRNPGNILITIPKTEQINDETTTLKIHLIDHSSCFGLGKLNGISVVAFKLHSQHLAVVKFDPVEKAKQFSQYLNKVPISDRILIKKTLNRFAVITNDQLDHWITEIEHLLSSSQYNRIHNVLYRQRDIAKRYVIEWGITPRFLNTRPNETDQLTLDMNDIEV